MIADRQCDALKCPKLFHSVPGSPNNADCMLLDELLQYLQALQQNVHIGVEVLLNQIATVKVSIWQAPRKASMLRAVPSRLIMEMCGTRAQPPALLRLQMQLAPIRESMKAIISQRKLSTPLKLQSFLRCLRSSGHDTSSCRSHTKTFVKSLEFPGHPLAIRKSLSSLVSSMEHIQKQKHKAVWQDDQRPIASLCAVLGMTDARKNNYVG